MLETFRLTDREACARWLDQDLRLTPTQTRIARVLQAQFGAWVDRDVLVRSVWPGPTDDAALFEADAHALRSQLSRLRRKLDGTPWAIQNHYRHGCYRLVRADGPR